jgi:hypothetical protein
MKILETTNQLQIKDTHFISGVIIKDEIQNMYLDLYTGETESFSLEF